MNEPRLYERADDEDEVVRLDCEIVIPITAVVPRDVYEAWQDGDLEARDLIMEVLDYVVHDETNGPSFDSDDVQLREAWLIETGQGHPIVRLKDFKE